MNGIKSKFAAGNNAVKSKYSQQQTQAHGMGAKDRWRVARGENVRWEQYNAGRSSSQDEEGTTTSGRHRLPPPPPGMGSSSSSPAPMSSRSPPPPPSLPLRSSIGAQGGSQSKAPPPPPPARTGATAPPPLPRSTKPSLPPRMNNEAGIDNPPPPYVPAYAANAGNAANVTMTQSSSPVQTTSPLSLPGSGNGPIEFSQFAYEDKQQFFALLDEYFASKGANGSPA